MYIGSGDEVMKSRKGELHMPSPLILVTCAKLGTGVVPDSGSM